MHKARIIVIIIGVFVPYLARLPGGMDTLGQYVGAGFLGFLLIEALNSVTWGSILAISFSYKRQALIVFPSLLGFGYLAFQHYSLDLSSNPNAPIALAIIPFYSLVPIGIGGVIGYVIDWYLKRNDVN